MAKRMQKISKMYEDSTKEFKEQQKEMGIKQAETKILDKAKKDQKKIEDYKRKFRENQTGGQFTNRLTKMSAENIKNKID